MTSNCLFDPKSLKARIQNASKRFDRFWHKDDDGATAIEFALIAAPFIASIFFVLMFGHMLWANATLEQSVREAARQIRLGNVVTKNLSLNDFKSMVCDGLVVPTADCLSTVVVNVESAKSLPLPNTSPFGAGGALDETRTKYEPGKSSDYVVVTAVLPMDSLNGLYRILKSSHLKNYYISSTMVVRNEPF